MARVPRRFSVVAGLSTHKVWRGHNREGNLETAEQKERYLEYMNEDLNSDKYQPGSSLHALTVMSNHTHEISQIQNQALYSNHMRRHHARYGRYFNDAKERCGKVAQDRPHTSLIADDYHQMICTFYVHANAHRAHLPDAENYEYSTHMLYAQGKRRPWMRNIVFPRWYLDLGRTMELRRKKYRRLFALYLEATGKQKQHFLRRRFFGPLVWIHEKEKEVAQWWKSQRPAPS